MLEITRGEFLNYALIPEIANAEEIAWFKSHSNANKLAIIVKTKQKKYTYLIFQKENNEDYILYPSEINTSFPNYSKTYFHLQNRFTGKI